MSERPASLLDGARATAGHPTGGGSLRADVGGTTRGFRPEIQALRALAVGSVLLYHLWPGTVRGGFVGVDVFFVISGYLITGHLLRDAAVSGTVRLSHFWVRRARRLLPASLLVLAVVAVATLLVVPLSQRAAFLHEVLASTFYVENWSLAAASVDYLAADDVATPVQHYWSLGVEEQFYLVVPLLVLVLARFWRARRPVVLSALGLLAVVSLVWCVRQTGELPGVAYFSTLTRAWELLAGGLLAAAAAAAPRPVRHGLGWAGLAAILVAVVSYSGSTVFPGIAALLPVLGAVAVLAAADAGPVALVARLRPVTWVGDVSYAVYLWHWPLVVLVPAATGEALGPLDRCGVLVATLGLAWLSTRFVEEPLRRLPRTLDGRRPVLAVVGATVLATGLVGSLAAAGAAQSRHRIDQLQASAEQIVAAGDYTCLGAEAVGRSDCPDRGDLLVPAPAAAAEDDGNSASCWAGTDESVPRICHQAAPLTPRANVLVVGDSHSNALIPAWREIARTRGWNLDITGRAGCSWTSGVQDHPAKAFRTACAAWKQAIAAHLASHPAYDLILTTSRQSGRLIRPTHGETKQEATVAALHDVWAREIARGSVVIALRDLPLAREDVVACVERAGVRAATDCRAAPSLAFSGYDALTPAVAATPGSALVDLRDLLCTASGCTPVLGNVVVYHDQQHVTATFARTLAGVLGRRIDAAYARLQRDSRHG
ncbi:acyltransferase family protein [Nocardioides jiangxiensis]|uniref:Acyltransferase family protein n=1 Tax=Nocardioides jiangxiensis TaxID=3064524 RepID=A0ABT9B467_9ACTN|nr:acyltransferase family protein [Nocardioides sp. WY-20]MDO7869175.1 acyltransferase family protein [Nocardioides sp. WY-20]